MHLKTGSCEVGYFSDDDLTSGVWKPASFDEGFLTHEESNRMVYVGPGQQHSNWGGGDCDFARATDYVAVLAKYLEEGTIEPGKIYTSSIGVPQGIIFGDATDQQTLADMLAYLESLVSSGQVVFATYNEVLAAWETEYDSQPNIFTFDNMDPQDFTCR